MRTFAIVNRKGGVGQELKGQLKVAQTAGLEDVAVNLVLGINTRMKVILGTGSKKSRTLVLVILARLGHLVLF